MQLPPKPTLRLRGLALRCSCFITKRQHPAAEESKGEAGTKRPEIDLRDARQMEHRGKMSCGITAAALWLRGLSNHSPCYLPPWLAEEVIKTNHMRVAASCDKQIVGILDPLKHLTQGAAVTFKIKSDRHSWRGPWAKFDRQTEEGGPLMQAWQKKHKGHLKGEKRVPIRGLVLALKHIGEVELDHNPVWSNQWSHIGLIKSLNELC